MVSQSCNTKNVTKGTRFHLALLMLFIAAIAWMGSTIATIMWASQPGNAGAILFVAMVSMAGYLLTKETAVHMQHVVEGF